MEIDIPENIQEAAQLAADVVAKIISNVPVRLVS